MKLARAVALILLMGATAAMVMAAKKGKAPFIDEKSDGSRTLVLPDDVDTALAVEFPEYRMPVETDFNPAMLQYYYSRLVGVHPAVAWGDFNNDKKRDYVLLVITGDTKWGPLCELVVLNGLRSGYEAFRLGEVYSFKDDYVSYNENKLYKGRYKKGGWYITWDSKKNIYAVAKS